MAKKVNEVISYFENLYNNNSCYLWAANSEVITPELCSRLLRTFGNSKYDATYYSNKLAEGLGRIGADCSGAMFPMSGFDTTAKGYYSKCGVKGPISGIDRNKACLVFKGKSPDSIHHIGFYCGNGYTIEMESSKTNCVKRLLDKGSWNYYGIPDWIDYSSAIESPTTTVTVPTSTISIPTQTNISEIRGIDVSSYQGDIDWAKVKASGIEFAILRGVTKNGLLDTKFETNYQNAINAGVEIRGVYQFCYVLDLDSAKNAAANMVAQLQGKKVPIYLDLEWESLLPLGKDGISAITVVYVQTCKQLGYECNIYSNYNWYKYYINVEALASLGCKFWVAKYGAKPTDTAMEIWQYSNKGSVDGIGGNVDMDILYSVSKTVSTPIKVAETKSVQKAQTLNTSVLEVPVEMLGKVTTKHSNLNIRSSTSTSSDKNIVGKYKKGELVNISAKIGSSWYKTSKGYVYAQYIQQALGVVSNCSKLNMRSTPTSESDDNIITVLSVDSNLYLLEKKDKWYKAKTTEGVVGYVSSKYVTVK